MKKRIHLIILLFVVGFSFPVQSQSFYSAKGIGLVDYFVSGRSEGMGGVGLALVDRMTLNYMNPAALAELPLAYISGNLIHQGVDLSGSVQDATLSNTSVGGLQFSIPLKSGRVSLAVGLQPFSTIEYEFSDANVLGDQAFTEIVNGDGGVDSAFMTFAVKPTKRLYVGITGIYHFGVLRNKWRVLFDSANFRNTQDEVSRSFTEGNFRLGLIYKLKSNWTIGGVYSPSVTLDTKEALELENGFRLTDLANKEFKLPVTYGFGTSFLVDERLLLGLDYYTEKWSSVKQNGYVNDSYRIAFGLEYAAKRKLHSSFFKKVALRAGVYYRDIGLEQPLGERVTELFGTLGLGLPIKWSAGRLDLALEFGKRGSTPDNPIKETIVKFTGTITAGQKWFFRGVKR